ncbi:MAG: dipeptidase [Saprospiraceae bacterium]
MKKTQEYIQRHRDRFLEELLELLRIPSVSADSKHDADTARCADRVADYLKAAGLDAVEVIPTAGHPVVYGEKMIDPALPTILTYGHYDVQPPDPVDLWDTPPFEPTIKKTAIHPEGAVFGRGTADDKGQFFMHVKAIEAMVAAGELSCNVKVMIEGEEEVGSSNLETFLREHTEKLAADVILVSDTSIIGHDTPSITTGLRGLSYVEVDVFGPNRDLHSGVYGGAVANPINVLCELIAGMTDENKHVTIPGFYDKVEELSAADRKALNEAPFNEADYKTYLGIGATQGEAGYTTLERTSIRPTLDVNGIWGGYTGEGAKTVLPSSGHAKISMRLVPHQNDEEITQLFRDYFEAQAPDSVRVVVRPHHGGLPSVTPTDTPEYRAAEQAMKATFGKDPIPKREGGSIPIVALFEEVLGLKSILMGFGLDSDGLHSPNEHYGLFNFYRGIETIPYYYQFYVEEKK